MFGEDAEWSIPNLRCHFKLKSGWLFLFEILKCNTQPSGNIALLGLQAWSRSFVLFLLSFIVQRKAFMLGCLDLLNSKKAMCILVFYIYYDSSTYLEQSA